MKTSFSYWCGGFVTTAYVSNHTELMMFCTTNFSPVQQMACMLSHRYDNGENSCCFIGAAAVAKPYPNRKYVPCEARFEQEKNAQKNKRFDALFGGIGKARGAILTALRGASGKRAGCIKYHFANSFAPKWRFSY